MGRGIVAYVVAIASVSAFVAAPTAARAAVTPLEPAAGASVIVGNDVTFRVQVDPPDGLGPQPYLVVASSPDVDAKGKLSGNQITQKPMYPASDSHFDETTVPGDIAFPKPTTVYWQVSRYVCDWQTAGGYCGDELSEVRTLVIAPPPPPPFDVDLSVNQHRILVTNPLVAFRGRCVYQCAASVRLTSGAWNLELKQALSAGPKLAAYRLKLDRAQQRSIQRFLGKRKSRSAALVITATSSGNATASAQVPMRVVRPTKPRPLSPRERAQARAVRQRLQREAGAAGAAEREIEWVHGGYIADLTCHEQRKNSFYSCDGWVTENGGDWGMWSARARVYKYGRQYSVQYVVDW